MALLHEGVCLLFDAHKTDDFTLAQFATYRRAMQGVCRVVFLMHAAKGAQHELPPEALVLDDAAIFDRAPCAKGKRRWLLPGSLDLKMVAAVEALPGPTRFIFVEYDALATRDLRQALLDLIAFTEGADLAASFVGERARNSSWMWWDSLLPPEGVACAPGDLRKAFLPLCVFSRRLMTAHRAALNAGWTGHQEVLLPTTAQSHGMTLRDLSRAEPRFTQYPQFNIHAPGGLDAEPLPAFIHPVKSVAQFLALPEALRAGCDLDAALAPPPEPPAPAPPETAPLAEPGWLARAAARLRGRA